MVLIKYVCQEPSKHFLLIIIYDWEVGSEEVKSYIACCYSIKRNRHWRQWDQVLRPTTNAIAWPLSSVTPDRLYYYHSLETQTLSKSNRTVFYLLLQAPNVMSISKLFSSKSPVMPWSWEARRNNTFSESPGLKPSALQFLAWRNS